MDFKLIAAIVALPLIFIVGVFQTAKRTGWARMSEIYRCNRPWPADKMPMRYFRSGSSSAYCLTVAGDSAGMFLGMTLPIFWIGHPHLFIPWEDITFSVVRTNVEIKFRNIPGVVFELSKKTVLKVRPQALESAGQFK